MSKQPKALMLIDQLDEIATYSSKLASWALDVANALERLYVANQELVAALDRLMNGTTDLQDAMEANKQARAALAKARGEV